MIIQQALFLTEIKQILKLNLIHQIQYLILVIKKDRILFILSIFAQKNHLYNTFTFYFNVKNCSVKYCLQCNIKNNYC
jgi:hypothetical protein